MSSHPPPLGPPPSWPPPSGPPPAGPPPSGPPPSGPPPGWQPPRGSRRRIGLILGVVGAVSALALIVTGVIVVVGGDEDRSVPSADRTEDPDPTDTTEGTEGTDPPVSEEPEFKDWLAPKKTIKVGKQRAVSACQVLTYDDVREIYADTITPGTQVTENYFAVSQPFPKDGYYDHVNRCEYEDVVVLNGEPYPSRKAMREENRLSGLGVDEDELPRELKLYRRAAKASDDEELKAVVDLITRSSRAALESQRRFSFDDKSFRKRGITHANVILPRLFGGLEFIFFVDTMSYELIDESFGVGDPDLSSLTPLELADRLKKVSQVVGLVRERTVDPTLSQSPSPTIQGESPLVGGAPIVEPCAVLTPALMKETLVFAPNRPSERRSLPPVPSPVEPGADIVHPSACEHTAYLPKEDAEVSAEIEIRAAGSGKVLRRALTAEKRGEATYFPLGRAGVKPKTKADHAWEFALDGDRYYHFSVGGYLFDLRLTIFLLDTDFGEESHGSFSREVHVRVINALVTSFRKHLDQVEAQLE